VGNDDDKKYPTLTLPQTAYDKANHFWGMGSRSNNPEDFQYEVISPSNNEEANDWDDVVLTQYEKNLFINLLKEVDPLWNPPIKSVRIQRLYHSREVIIYFFF
ncbi:hypothetical protein M1146_07595, partial [Patescibacteria group bacterium]|nr:hypothetical protein [Patescibacteria group bacterium]